MPLLRNTPGDIGTPDFDTGMGDPKPDAGGGFPQPAHRILTGIILLGMLMMQVAWGLWMPVIRPWTSLVGNTSVDMMKSLIGVPLQRMWMGGETPGSDNGVSEEVCAGGVEVSAAPFADMEWEPPNPLEGMVWEG